MSDLLPPLRVALVAEGVTDFEVIQAALASMLGDRSFVIQLVQPESSVAFTGGGGAGPLGGGWEGVYRWCLQARERSGRISADVVLDVYDAVVVHLDADVADATPPERHKELIGSLPCSKPCPPASDAADALRELLLRWLGESTRPPRLVLCTPSKNTEAWMMRIFFPDDKEMRRKGWECHPAPLDRLGQQPKKSRFGKNRRDYLARSRTVSEAWPRVCDAMSEAARFRDEFTGAVAAEQSGPTS